MNHASEPIDAKNSSEALEPETQRELFSAPLAAPKEYKVDTEEAREMIKELVILEHFEAARRLFLTSVSALNEWSNSSAQWLYEMTQLVRVYCEMEQKADNPDSIQRAAHRLLDICRVPIHEIDVSALAPAIAAEMESIVEILTKNRQYLAATSLLNRILSMRFTIAKHENTLENMNYTASIIEKLAISTHMQGHLYEAEKLFRMTLGIREAACKRDNSAVQNWHKAGTMELMGDLFSVMNLSQKAYYYFGQCINILEAAQAKANKPERVMRHITSIKNKLGDVALNNHDYVQARIFYEEALYARHKNLEYLIKQGSAETENAIRDLVFSLLRLSDLDFRESKIEKCEEKLNETIVILDTAITMHGEKVKLLESYYVPLDRQIRIQAQKGNAKTHAALVEKMNHLLRRLVMLEPNNLVYQKWFEDF